MTNNAQCTRTQTDRMHASEEQNILYDFTAEDCRSLQDALLGVVYNETAMKLLILQRSQRMDTKQPIARRKSTQRKVSQVSGNHARNGQAAGMPGCSEPEVEQLLDEHVLNAVKYERDLEALRAVYVAAYEDLEENTVNTGLSCNRLEQAVEALHLRNNEETEARDALQKSKDELQALQTEVAHMKTAAATQLQQYDDRIADAKHKLKCVSRVNDLEFDLVKRWEESRLAQVRIWGENAERAYLREILEYKRRIASEERIMHEVQAYRNGEMHELRSKLVAWQQKYANEMKQVGSDLQAQEELIANVHKSLERHREIYEQRVAFVKEYEEQKAEEQRLLELELHRVNCAIRIQAWWRGTMVRRGLGPYKKKPKKGKKAKAKGK